MQVLDCDPPIIPLFPPEDIDVPKDPELDKIKGRLDKVGTRLDAIETTIVRLTKSKWSIGYDWAINHKGTSIILGIVLTAVSIFGGAKYKYYLDHQNDSFNNAVDARIAGELKKPDGIVKTLANVQETVNRTDATLTALTPFIHDVIRNELDKAAASPHAKLQDSLPLVRQAVTLARSQNVLVDLKTVNMLGTKLTKVDPNASDFWPTALEFISYRSQIVVSDREALTLPNIPNCTDQQPTGMTVQSITPLAGGQQSVGVGNAHYSDCRMTLDSPEENEKLNSILRHKAGRITFTHCLIVYNGGAINLILEFKNDPRFAYYFDESGVRHSAGKTTVSGPTMEFDNCLLNFRTIGKPERYGQQLAQSVLSQSKSAIILPPVAPSGLSVAPH